MDYAWGANGLDAIITQVQGGLPEAGTRVSPSSGDQDAPGVDALLPRTPILRLAGPVWTCTFS